MFKLLAKTLDNIQGELGCRPTFPRHLLHRITTLALSVSVVVIAQSLYIPALNAQSSDPPNIVLILADDHDHDADHDHGGDHDHHHEIVRVSLFDEWHDVIRWLPGIAADSDLPKTVWDAIRARCRELEALEESLKATEPERRREEYRQQARDFEVVLKSLRNRVDEYEHWDEVFPD